MFWRLFRSALTASGGPLETAQIRWSMGGLLQFLLLGDQTPSST